VFEWHQQYSAAVRGRDVEWSEIRTSSWTHSLASNATEPARSIVSEAKASFDQRRSTILLNAVA
jgi:hypothetical protein